jgi:hypothetical protein
MGERKNPEDKDFPKAAQVLQRRKHETVETLTEEHENKQFLTINLGFKKKKKTG